MEGYCFKSVECLDWSFLRTPTVSHELSYCSWKSIRERAWVGKYINLSSHVHFCSEVNLVPLPETDLNDVVGSVIWFLFNSPKRCIFYQKDKLPKMANSSNLSFSWFWRKGLKKIPYFMQRNSSQHQDLLVWPILSWEVVRIGEAWQVENENQSEIFLLTCIQYSQSFLPYIYIFLTMLFFFFPSFFPFLPSFPPSLPPPSRF